MIKPRVYLDSTILITFVFGAKKEPEKFKDFEHNKRTSAKFGLLMILSIDIEIAPMLERGLRIMHSREFGMEDKSDIPHAISAFIEGCDYIVSYDSHFKALTKIKSLTPGELLESIKY